MSYYSSLLASFPRVNSPISSSWLHKTSSWSSSSEPMTSNSILPEKRALRKQIQSVLRELPKDALASQGEAVVGHLERFGPFIGANRVGCYVSMSSAELPTSLLIDRLIQAKKKVFLPFVSSSYNSPIGDKQSESSSNLVTTRKPSTRMDLLHFNPPSNYTSFSPSEHLVPVQFSASSPDIFQFDPTIASGLTNALDQGLDLLLLPGVGFDEHGNRLGHGKGYYDRFIAEMIKKAGGETEDEENQKETSAEVHLVKEKLNFRRPILVGICLREQLLPATKSIPCQPHDQTLDYLVSPDGIISFPQQPH